MEQTGKIIERIQKLLALSQSSNAHEAASALAKAQALLAEHNLSMAHVQMQNGVTSAYVQESYDIKGRDYWRRVLLRHLAIHNFCEVISLRDTWVSLIGETCNIQAVQAMYAFLLPQLERMATASHRAYQRNGGLVAARTWKMNFFYGAVDTIKQRLAEEKRAFEAQSNACRSLIVVKDRDLREAVQRFHPKVTQKKITYTSAPEGYARGVEAGKQVQFRGQIGQ